MYIYIYIYIYINTLAESPIPVMIYFSPSVTTGSLHTEFTVLEYAFAKFLKAILTCFKSFLNSFFITLPDAFLILHPLGALPTVNMWPMLEAERAFDF